MGSLSLIYRLVSPNFPSFVRSSPPILPHLWLIFGWNWGAGGTAGGNGAMGGLMNLTVVVAPEHTGGDGEGAREPYLLRGTLMHSLRVCSLVCRLIAAAYGWFGG